MNFVNSREAAGLLDCTSTFISKGRAVSKHGMAQTQDMSVARAVFTSALLRSEQTAPDISRDDATLFARTLLKTCNVCTTSNIKLCKSFIITSILPSSARTGALMKYLVTLSKSCIPRNPGARVDTTKPGDENEGLGKIVNGKVQQPPEPSFKRLHILYLVHDLVVYIHSHQKESNHRDSGYSKQVTEQLYPDVCTLAELAACGCGGKATKTCAITLEILSLWKASEIFAPEQTAALRSKILLADGTEWNSLLARLAKTEQTRADSYRKKLEDETKWILPERHGVPNDPTAPWHELPAANGLYLRRKHGYPLRASGLPAAGMRLQHGGREADPELKQDVMNLYTEVIRCYDKYTKADEVQDVDALGNIIWKDPERPTRNYWGFTLEGIERKRELAKKFEESAVGYDGYGQQYPRVNDAIERAKQLAGGRGRGMGIGMGPGRGGAGRGGWRGGRGW